MSTHKKTFEVIPAKEGARNKTYKVGGKEFSFQGHNQMFVSDPAVAKDLDQLHGGKKNSESDELRVIEVNNMEREPGHKYSFSLASLGNWKDRIDWEN